MTLSSIAVLIKTTVIQEGVNQNAAPQDANQSRSLNSDPTNGEAVSRRLNVMTKEAIRRHQFRRDQLQMIEDIEIMEIRVVMKKGILLSLWAS
jgi:hypothetical protein